MKVDYSKNTVFNINKLQKNSYVKSNTLEKNNIINILDYEEIRTINDESFIEKKIKKKKNEIIEFMKDYNYSKFSHYINENFEYILVMLQDIINGQNTHVLRDSLYIKLSKKIKYTCKNQKLKFVYDILIKYKNDFKYCLSNFFNTDLEKKTELEKLLELIFEVNTNKKYINMIKYNNILETFHTLFQGISNEIYNHVNFITFDKLYSGENINIYINNILDNRILIFLQEFYNLNIFLIDSNTREPIGDVFYDEYKSSVVLLYDKNGFYERIGFYKNKQVKRIFDNSDEIVHLFI